MKALLFLAAVGAATIAPPASPPPRIGHVMTTAGADGGVFMLGGAVSAGDSLWRWSCGAWQPLRGGGPVTRSMAAAAFDTRRGVLVIFGGAGTRNGSRYGDTWEWNGHASEERDAPTPGARDHHAMAYDEARGQVVMYGGWDADHTSFPADTLTWDGTAWTKADSTSGPGGAGHHAMAYDSRRQRVVMFGGGLATSPYNTLADTWQWDGARWTSMPAG